MTVKTTYEELERKIKFLERELDETRTQAEAFKFTKSISRAAPLSIGMVVNRVITQANERMCAMLGYTSKELLGREVRLLYLAQEDYK
jgi:PAS domain S-box-containing protein